MKRFGYFVRLGGDAEISEALARGAAGALQPMPRSSSEAVRRVAMWQHSPEEWDRMTKDARRRYRRNRQPKGLGKALLVSWAVVCLGARAAFDAMWKAIEASGEAGLRASNSERSGDMPPETRGRGKADRRGAIEGRD